MVSSNRITDFVEEFARLQGLLVDAKKAAREAGLDSAALQRAARSTPASVLKRQVQIAIEHQVRHLAGRESKPAEIPPGSDLEKVAALCAKGMSAREIGAELGFGNARGNGGESREEC